MHRSFSVYNVVARIRSRLSTITPTMSLVYDGTRHCYWLSPADGSVNIGPFDKTELLGLLRYIGTARKSDRDDYRVMHVPRPGQKGADHEILFERPLSKAKHFKFMTLLEHVARQRVLIVQGKLCEPQWGPVEVDKRGVVDDTAPDYRPLPPVQFPDLPQPEAPQAASAPPEPDFDLPDFDMAPSREPLEHHSV